jgi:NAD+ kinase
MPEVMNMKKIGLVYHPLNERALEQARNLAQLVSARGLKSWLCSAWEQEDLRAKLTDTDLIVTAGGDGTILRVAQIVAEHNIPITGVNLGKLGFMTELSTTEAEKKMTLLLDGEGWIDERAILEAEIRQESEDGKTVQYFHALNDVVVARGEIARIINIMASIDGDEVATYKADGAIVATATGSTGYSLAAGGPILHPQAQDYLLLPIAPHISFHHSLLVPHHSTVKLKLTTNHQSTLSIDGHISLPLHSGAVITVKSSPKRIKFLRIRPRGHFYTSLEQKLKG